MSSTSVFIDGGPFYDALHARGCSVDIDYSALVGALAGPVVPGAATYYMAPIPDGPYPERSRHHSAVRDMVSAQGITVKTGRMEVVYSAFVERGIEALMCTDVVCAAHSSEVDSILLISHRPELVPAVEAARAAGSRVRVAHFENTVEPTLNELTSAADEFIPITVADILALPLVGPTQHRVRA